MKLTRITIKFLCLMLVMTLVWSCNGKSGNQSQTTEEQEGTREPTDDEIREYGRVMSVADAQYPMFIITLEFPERQYEHPFNFNVEESDLDAQTVTALEGKYVTIYYLSEMESTVLDVVYECETLTGADMTIYDGEEFSEITGTMSGAENISGDLPGTFKVTSADGEEMDFEEFITEEMVQANGKEVTVYYYGRGVDTITYLKESEN